MTLLPDAIRAARILLVLFAALGAFHVLLMAGLIPAGIAWGGRIDRSDPAFLLLEAVALVQLALFAAIVALRAGLIGGGRLRRTVRVAAWLVFAFFAVNTVGNLAAHSAVERWAFTPLAVVLSLLALRVARG